MRTDAFWWSAAADDAEKPPLCKIRLDQRRAEAGAASPAVSQEIKVFLFIFHSAPAWGEPCVWASRWTEMESDLFLGLVRYPMMCTEVSEHVTSGYACQSFIWSRGIPESIGLWYILLDVDHRGLMPAIWPGLELGSSFTVKWNPNDTQILLVKEYEE